MGRFPTSVQRSVWTSCPQLDVVSKRNWTGTSGPRVEEKSAVSLSGKEERKQRKKLNKLLSISSSFSAALMVLLQEIRTQTLRDVLCLPVNVCVDAGFEPGFD